MPMSIASTSETLTVLIVGCGNIAGGYDECGSSEAIRSHAGAYSRDPRFQISACVEPNSKRRKAFMTYWKIKEGYHDLASCLDSGQRFDLVSLCLPTPEHGEALKAVLALKPRCVFAEKPLTDDPVFSRRILDDYNRAGVSIAVNYLRRWDKHMVNLRNELKEGTWGNVQSISGIYARGLFNCGSHFFDLLSFLIGPLQPRAVLGQANDGRIDDPTLSVFLETDCGAPVTLIGIDENSFFSFEVDLVMEKGRLVIEDQGGQLRCRKIQKDKLYPHQSVLEQGYWEKTGLNFALSRAVENIFDHLEKGVSLVSSAKNVLEAEELCAHIMNMNKKGDAY